MKLIFSSRAKADLIAIGDFIAMDSPLRAYRLVETIEQKCADLCQTPARYPLVPRHEESGIRRMVHGPYLIFYRIEAGPCRSSISCMRRRMWRRSSSRRIKGLPDSA